MMTRMRTTQRGFTIIELVVVLAIIGLMLSFVMISTQGIQEKNRDNKRLSDMNEIQKALGLYYSDYGKFPASVNGTVITGDDDVSQALEDDLLISETPRDPLHPTYTYTYQTDVGGSTYSLSFCLETDRYADYASGCGNTIAP